MKIKIMITFLTLFMAISCVEKPKDQTSSNKLKVKIGIADSPVLSTAYISNNKLHITGNNLIEVKDVKLKQSTNVYDLIIESKTNTKIISSIAPTISLAVDAISSIFVSNAFGQSTIPITFILNDNSVSSSKIIDGSVTSLKLNSMGASTGEVLIYDGLNWNPGSLSGLNYKGAHTALNGSVTVLTPGNGDFYIIDNNSGAIDLDGAGPLGLLSYSQGDWIVYDFANAIWNRVNSVAAGNFWNKTANDLSYVSGDIIIGPAANNGVLTVSEAGLIGTNNGDMLAIFGNDTNPGIWNRSMSYGFNNRKEAKIGVFGIDHTAMDYFYITTNGASPTPWNDGMFTILKSGNIGIGTITPATLLEVAGPITATTYFGDGSNLTGIANVSGTTDPTNTVIQADSNSSSVGEIQFKVGATTHATIDNNGRFVLGDSSTTKAFAVRSPASTDIEFISYQAGAGNSTNLILGSNRGTNPASGELDTVAPDRLGKISFSGYLGAFTTAAEIRSDALGTWGAGSTGADLTFWTTPDGAAAPLERLTIDGAGNIGIGKSTPVVPLDVVGNVAFSADLSVDTNTFFVDSITNRVGISNGAPSVPLDVIGEVKFSTNFTVDTNTFFVDATNNNVGIGTLVPNIAYALHVAGTVAGSAPFVNTSDERYKDDISVIKNAREKIRMLNGVNFVWRTDEFPHLKFSKKPDMGVIAQNIEKVFPEAVIVDDQGYMSVAYAKLVAPLIEAFKEIDDIASSNAKRLELMSNGIIAKQERRISSLEQEVDQLRIANEQLKKFLCMKFTDAPSCP